MRAMRVKGAAKRRRRPRHAVHGLQSPPRAVQVSCRRRSLARPRARGRSPVLLVESVPIASDKLELCRLTTTAPTAALEQLSAGQLAFLGHDCSAAAGVQSAR